MICDTDTIDIRSINNITILIHQKFIKNNKVAKHEKNYKKWNYFEANKKMIIEILRFYEVCWTSYIILQQNIKSLMEVRDVIDLL